MYWQYFIAHTFYSILTTLNLATFFDSGTQKNKQTISTCF